MDEETKDVTKLRIYYEELVLPKLNMMENTKMHGDVVITSITFVFNAITTKKIETRSWFKFGTLMIWK